MPYPGMSPVKLYFDNGLPSPAGLQSTNATSGWQLGFLHPPHTAPRAGRAAVARRRRPAAPPRDRVPQHGRHAPHERPERPRKSIRSSPAKWCRAPSVRALRANRRCSSWRRALSREVHVGTTAKHSGGCCNTRPDPDILATSARARPAPRDPQAADTASRCPHQTHPWPRIGNPPPRIQAVSS
jgi:hypothetical protein